MAIHIKGGGVWKEAQAQYVKDGGVWKEVQESHVRDGGIWKPAYVSGTWTLESDFNSGSVPSSWDNLDPAKVTVEVDPSGHTYALKVDIEGTI